MQSALRLTKGQQIAQHALTILVNLAADGEILRSLATDDKFLNVIFSRITVCILIQSNIEKLVGRGNGG